MRKLIPLLLVGLLAACYPFDGNTGVVIDKALLVPSGSITTTHDGQVIEGLVIDGSINVEHSNVVLRNFMLVGGTIYINESQTGATNLLIEDCEMDGLGFDGAAVAEHNYTIRRCDIQGYADGLRVNGNVTIEDNFLHDFPDFVAQGAHQDAVQITSGSNIVIRHNTLNIGVDGCNSAVMIGTYTGDDILVEDNLLAAACGYVAYGGDNQYTNVRYINNRISTFYHVTGGFHGVFAQAEQATLTSNVWHDGPNKDQPVG